MGEQKANLVFNAILQSHTGERKLIRTATQRLPFAYQHPWRWLPMHSIACFFGLLFLVIFALIAIPILILVAKLIGLAFIVGAIALIVLGIWKLFDLAEPRYRPY